ncbi:MAG: hypothetical protein DSO07_13120 [Thermoproteota archaeon]|jgi:hypothetical protein|uniref:Class III signal peptide-containing protein n=1 Tax=Candidatus Methanodesulfokora washburnensis TaxID=2478471 RepID=A0A3R9PFU2_9CREN|nr:hypothetical protein [Candidatus Methanodesulfokores washburnensis]RSN72255.1 hypothetical protein D6D85_14565 [Candidatus Methanodesulfokores washburnensis]TDA36876.1 MAG: hypothetical protein DSO07_13120 [Candidatus Korarchaeota archaeon]
MSNVVVGVLVFLLGIVLIIMAVNFIYPYIQQRAAEQQFFAVKSAAITMSEGIERVVAAGVGSATTVKISLPPNTVVISGPSSVRFVMWGGPPYQHAVNITNGSVTYVGVVPKGTSLEIQVNMTSGWTLVVEGTSMAGRENNALISYVEPYKVKISWRG